IMLVDDDDWHLPMQQLSLTVSIISLSLSLSLSLFGFASVQTEHTTQTSVSGSQSSAVRHWTPRCQLPVTSQEGRQLVRNISECASCMPVDMVTPINLTHF